MFKVHIIPNDKGNPPGKLADAELHFEAEAGPLAGQKLIGFSVWESVNGRNVTFPARSYSVNGDRRSFALVRPIKDGSPAPLREVILAAYANWEAAVDETARENADIESDARQSAR
jgi:hypothetical protein